MYVCMYIYVYIFVYIYSWSTSKALGQLRNTDLDSFNIHLSFDLSSPPYQHTLAYVSIY